MFEAVAAFLVVLSISVLVAHAVDAFRSWSGPRGSTSRRAATDDQISMRERIPTAKFTSVDSVNRQAVSSRFMARWRWSLIE